MLTKANATTKETVIGTLSMRLNEPYWVLHQGNCEHFIVVDQIRYGWIWNVVPACPIPLFGL